MKDILIDLHPGWVFIILSAGFNAASSTMAKHRLNAIGEAPVNSIYEFSRYVFRFFQSRIIWAAFILFIISPFFSLAALNYLEMSVAYPANYSLNLLFILMISLFFLDEKLTLKKIIGALFLGISFYLFYGDT